MKLKELTIRLQRSYEENPGKYTAEIEYEDKTGNVKVLLDAQISDALLGFIGPTLTQFSHRAALEIEKNLIQSIEESKRVPEIAVEATV